MNVIGRTDESASFVLRISFLFKENPLSLRQKQLDIPMRGNYCLHRYYYIIYENNDVFKEAFKIADQVV